MTFWETKYIFQPAPSSSQSHLQSPVSPEDNPTTNDSKIPTFSFNKQGTIDRISLNLTAKHIFYEEKSQNGIVKILKIHLLGYEGCEAQFQKYSDTVEKIEFNGCIENVNQCFQICGLMKKLTEVIFVLTKIPHNLKYFHKKCIPASNLVINPTVVFIHVYTENKIYSRQTAEIQGNINDCIESILRYSSIQFPKIHSLRLNIPDTNNLLLLAKDLLKFCKDLPKNSKLEVYVDSRICAKIDKPLLSPPTLHNGSSDPIKTNNDIGNLQKDPLTQANATEAHPQYSRPTPTEPYAYGMSTAERLLKESSTPADSKVIPIKRVGETLVNSDSPKRSMMETEENRPERPESECRTITADRSTETENVTKDFTANAEDNNNQSHSSPRRDRRLSPNTRQDERELGHRRRSESHKREHSSSGNSFRGNNNDHARRSPPEYSRREDSSYGFSNRSRGARYRGSRRAGRRGSGW